MPEALQIRIHGDDSRPTLIYLPGLHGDWTLAGGFRKQLGNKVRFVEFIYPRTLTWSLDDYAAAIETALSQNNITAGWLLGESFGSQILWPLVQRRNISVQGLILAGGFVRHPMPWGARFLKHCSGKLTLALLTPLVKSYGMIGRRRFRHSPETRASLQEFVARRTPADFYAARHRLQLIAEYDPRAIAQNCQTPVFYLSGWLDPVVPWPAVQRWLRKHCPALRGVNIIRPADHNVLGTAPAQAASQVLSWMKS